MTRPHRASRGSFRRRRDCSDSERGDTLIEILVAVLILSVAGVALLSAFSTNIAGSAAHRKLANNDMVLRGISEAAYSQIQLGSQVALPLYQSCAQSYLIDSPYSGYVAEVVGVQYWNPSAATWVSSPCPTSGQSVQLVTIKVKTSLGTSIGTTNIVVNGLGTGAGASQPRAGGMSVTSISPTWLNQGAKTDLTIYGTGFASSDSVSFQANSGVSVGPGLFTYVSSTELKVPVTVSSSATRGQTAVTVSSGVQSASGSIQISAVTVNPVTLVAGQYESVTVSGTDFLAAATPTFTTSPSAATIGATVNSVSPATGVDGVSSIGADVLSPVPPSLPAPLTITVKNPDGSSGSNLNGSIVGGPTLSSCSLTSSPGPSPRLRSNEYSGNNTSITCMATIPGYSSGPVTANGVQQTVSAASGGATFSATFPAIVVSSTSTTTGTGDSKVKTTTTTYAGTVTVSYHVQGGLVTWPGSATVTTTTTSK